MSKSRGLALILLFAILLSSISIAYTLPSGIPDGYPMPSGIPEGYPIPTGIPEGYPIPTGIPDGYPLPTGIPDGYPIPTSSPTGNPAPTPTDITTGLPNSVFPQGFTPPTGMNIPAVSDVHYDIATGKLIGSDGKEFNIPNLSDLGSLSMNMPTGVDGMPLSFPTMTDGFVLPMVDAETSKGYKPDPTDQIAIKGLFGETPIEPKTPQEIAEFADKFKNLDISNLDGLAVDSLDHLLLNAGSNEKNIFDIDVRNKMDEIYETRNKQLGIGDVEEKIKALNKNIPYVNSVSVASLDQMIIYLQGVDTQLKGTNLQVKEGIKRCIDAKNTQIRVNGIYQQIAKLKSIKDQMTERSKRIIIDLVSSGGFEITTTEQLALEQEINAFSTGSITDIPSKISALTEKYKLKIEASGAKPEDFIKLSTLYEKANNMVKAQETLSQAISANPNDDGIILELANMYEKTNDLDKASQVLETSLKNNPLPQTRAMLADVKAKSGDAPASIKNIEIAIKDAPKTEDFYEKANSIYKGAGEISDYKVFVSGDKLEFDTKPVLTNGRTLVPIRTLTESMGADVQWDSVTQKANIVLEDKTIILTIGSKEALVNGETILLDAPANIISGRTMVPLRFVGESCNKDVGYYGDSKMITILDKNAP